MATVRLLSDGDMEQSAIIYPPLRILLLDSARSMSAELRLQGRSVGLFFEPANQQHAIELGGRGDADAILLAYPALTDAALNQISELVMQARLPIVLYVCEYNSLLLTHAVDIGAYGCLCPGASLPQLRSFVDGAVALHQRPGAFTPGAPPSESLPREQLIGLAKDVLMQVSGFDEATAHRTLQKMAMDNNLKLADIAERMITFQISPPAAVSDTSR